MTTEERITAFAELGKSLEYLSPETFEHWSIQAYQVNKWFTRDNVSLALKGVRKLLNREALEKWVAKYDLENIVPKRVGVVMAGNLPLAGFHDFLSVLISGHSIDIKSSSQDPVLIQKIVQLLIEIQPGFKDKIAFKEKINESDAVIATGSDNTSRYFEYYFSKRPHIIRKNRTSAAIISGNETPEGLKSLSDDIFTYFGMGCRNVSKIFIPSGYPPESLFEGFMPYSEIIQHTKYGNNYDYTKAIYLLKKIPFLEGGFVLLKEDTGLVSPISVVYYEFYRDMGELEGMLSRESGKIQIIVSDKGWYNGSIPFGEAQMPSLTDYADKIDTMEFLQSL